MKRPHPLLFGILALLLLAAAIPAARAQDFRGAEWCADCHMQQFNEWKVSGHPYKLTPGAIAKERPIPLPEGYNWDDISYVIGSYKWKIRFMDNDGYIITSVDRDGDGVAETDGMNQYNMMTGRWVNYHAGEMKPYDCGRCHTTGFSPEGNQDGLPGIKGTWAFGGIQCEECHGAGFAMNVDRSSALCGRCHIRGDAAVIPARGGFIRHHEQYNEMLASPHKNLACVDCHSPHKKSEFSIHTGCEDCHGDYAEAYAGSVMDRRGVTCVDCHMPFASKSAEQLGPFRGDVRTHLFRINTDRGAQMFTDDGAFVLLDAEGQGALTVDFACAACHTDKAFSWVQAKAKNFHQRGSYLNSRYEKFAGRGGRR